MHCNWVTWNIWVEIISTLRLKYKEIPVLWQSVWSRQNNVMGGCVVFQIQNVMSPSWSNRKIPFGDMFCSGSQSSSRYVTYPEHHPQECQNPSKILINGCWHNSFTTEHNLPVRVHGSILIAAHFRIGKPPQCDYSMSQSLVLDDIGQITSNYI